MERGAVVTPNAVPSQFQYGQAAKQVEQEHGNVSQNGELLEGRMKRAKAWPKVQRLS